MSIGRDYPLYLLKRKIDATGAPRSSARSASRGPYAREKNVRALRAASYSGDGQAVTALLAPNHALVWPKIDDIEPALLAASISGHTAVVSQLVEFARSALRGVNGFPPYTNISQVLPLDEALLLACRYRHPDLVEFLLNTGVDVHADRKCALPEACMGGNVRVVELLVSAGADIHRWTDVALARASAHGHLPVVEYLLGQGADVRAHESESLCYASQHGHLPIVTRLVDAGADIHANGDRPLFEASYCGHANVVEFLLAAGADIHEELDRALRYACLHGQQDVVGILLSAGADVHAFGDQSLLHAFEREHASVAEKLLLSGADAFVVDPFHPMWTVSLMPALRFSQALLLDDSLKTLWIAGNLRPRVRLAKHVQRARDRLDKPPTSSLGTATPTRDELIAHLKTAGRRFAREYWTEGIPLFFPALEEELGPVPECFVWPEPASI